MNYTYAADSQLLKETRLSGPVDATTSFAWTTGPTTNFTYDKVGRLASEVTNEGSSTLAAYYYTAYDNDNWLTTNTYTPASGVTGGAGTYTYTYQADGELTNSTNPVTSADSYSYNDNGDRTNGGFTSGVNNEAVTGANGGTTYAYKYDSEGNPTTQTAAGTTISYAWDNGNRLSQVTDATGGARVSALYTYDFNNERVAEVDRSGAGTTSYVYQYDASDVALVSTISGTTQTLAWGYLFDPTGNQTAPLAEEDGSGNVGWLLVDQNGSVQDVVSTSGTNLDHVIFDSYGNKIVSDTGTASLYGYQGMMQEPAIAVGGTAFLDYDNARWYSTDTGGFLSTDPSGFAAGDNNLYRFTGNDPINNTDPSGLMFETGNESDIFSDISSTDEFQAEELSQQFSSNEQQETSQLQQIQDSDPFLITPYASETSSPSPAPTVDPNLLNDLQNLVSQSPGASN